MQPAPGVQGALVFRHPLFGVPCNLFLIEELVVVVALVALRQACVSMQGGSQQALTAPVPHVPRRRLFTCPSMCTPRSYPWYHPVCFAVALTKTAVLTEQHEANDKLGQRNAQDPAS